MTRFSNNRSFAFAGSALGTTLISIVAAWMLTPFVFAPAQTHPGTQWDQSSSRPLYRLSPIPAGADWAA
jgi:hypothetical protein